MDFSTVNREFCAKTAGGACDFVTFIWPDRNGL